jgi:hypothetical protein
MEEVIGRVKAIKLFFEADGGRKVTVPELKSLTEQDRQELAELCAAELGKKLQEK